LGKRVSIATRGSIPRAPWCVDRISRSGTKNTLQAIIPNIVRPPMLPIISDMKPIPLKLHLTNPAPLFPPSPALPTCSVRSKDCYRFPCHRQEPPPSFGGPAAHALSPSTTFFLPFFTSSLNCCSDATVLPCLGRLSVPQPSVSRQPPPRSEPGPADGLGRLRSSDRTPRPQSPTTNPSPAPPFPAGGGTGIAIRVSSLNTQKGIDGLECQNCTRG
jgi:hypothetical protein